MPHDAVSVFVGPENCEAILGVKWRIAKELAVRLGVQRVRLGRTKVIPIVALRAALESPDAAAAFTPEPADATEAARSALAARRRAASR